MTKQKTIAAGWIEADNGHEYSNNPKFIIRILAEVKQQHKFVILLHKGYQSGSTVLAAVRQDGLEIACPVDWPGSSKKIKVLFRDDSRVWNYFSTKIISESEDTLKTAFPTELFRMQRRASFRVKMLSGCHASFRCRDRQYANLIVNDLSIGGMLVCLPAPEDGEVPKETAALSDIAINLPAAEDDKEELAPLLVAQGFVARFVEMEDGRKCLGVRFNPQGAEEKELLKFVRQSELTSLRKLS